jgi:hypothetical protein
MTRILCIALLASSAAVTAAETSWFSFAEAFTPRHGQVLEVAYRVYTAPMLTDILDSGVLVERLEIWPAEIHVGTGATFSLQHLQITAFGPDGDIQEHVPLTLDLEGPADLLDFEDFISFGHDIRATRPGQAKIWITSLVPSQSGEHARESILLTVTNPGIGETDQR